MFVSIDLCLVPIGVGTSLSPYIKVCIEIIKSEGLNYELGAYGTSLDGDWDKLFVENLKLKYYSLAPVTCDS